jgi:hypothetical protein
MRGTVSARLEPEIREPVEIALQIAVALGKRIDQVLDICLDRTSAPGREVACVRGDEGAGGPPPLPAYLPHLDLSRQPELPHRPEMKEMGAQRAPE